MRPFAPARPLAESLSLVAEEVDDLVSLAETVQTVISRLAVGAGDLPDTALMVDAQAADLLSQRLSGLAAFVRALAEAAPCDLSADIEDAVRALTLSEQARRLAGPLLAPPAEAGAGELTTFWD
ncbi:MAG TPA: hypothetical protein VFH92_02430 [Phenylobacterium sp.]|nr:hypothetical protein [Phenylobacterium sp.]